MSRGKREMGGSDQAKTDAVQNLDAQLGVRAYQSPDEGPALSIGQDRSQGSNGLGFVLCADDVFPELWVILGHDLPEEIWLKISTRGVQIRRERHYIDVFYSQTRPGVRAPAAEREVNEPNLRVMVQFQDQALCTFRLILGNGRLSRCS